MSDILTTTDYDLFRHLSGNRAVEPARVSRIMESIQTIGWVSNPIIVNEKMEIVDGQGRFEALRRLHMPIEYRVLNGANISHCRLMNDVNTPWKHKEFIASFAETGDESYKRLWQLMNQFDVDCRTIFRLINKRENQERKLKNGEFVLSREDFGRALTKLPIFSAYWKAMKRFRGNGGVKKKVIFFLIGHGGYPHQRIVDTLKACDPNEIYCTTDERLIDCIEKAVNRNQRSENRLNLLMDYRSK